ncbi:MAG: GMC family oxidoreductase [Pikeienuella sp.]
MGDGPAESFDFVIVGAGSAGATLANRQTACGRYSVLLLEAGGSDRKFWVQLPIGYGQTYTDPRVNWRYVTEPVPGLGGRTSYWPRGKILGGSSSINAMVYARGHPSDFEDWAQHAPGWGWDDVAPIYRRLEGWTGPASPERGADGPLAVTDISEDVHPLCRTYLTAAEEIQIGRTDDYNGAAPEGAGYYQITTRGGLRASTARCYLRPALGRRNLELRTRALATEILFEGRRAVGLRYLHNGRPRIVRARCAVILSAGAINTPQLLQLSGVGPGALLQEMEIPVRAENPNIGRHLQDHLGADHVFRARVPTLNQVFGRWSGCVRAGLTYLHTRRGPLSLSVNQAGGFVRSAPEAEAPDIQLYFSPLSYTRSPPTSRRRRLLRPDPFPGFMIGFSPCRPTSRGELAIRSPDPLAPPRIQPNYLDTQEDRDLMRRGSRLARRLAAAPALKAVIEAEISPGTATETDAQVDGFIRDTAWTVFHPCGTARMGTDPSQSVVDPRLRAHGLEGLRVVDASVFPNVTSGNINAPVIMVAEKAADLILEDARAGPI